MEGTLGGYPWCLRRAFPSWASVQLWLSLRMLPSAHSLGVESCMAGQNECRGEGRAFDGCRELCGPSPCECARRQQLGCRSGGGRVEVRAGSEENLGSDGELAPHP